ncbi:MAG: tail fiber domain-containing protein [Phycisphaerae bacterium]|nr:tail fiber domain-containing protein [Saprospiraceae bacterium]
MTTFFAPCLFVLSAIFCSNTAMAQNWNLLGNAGTNPAIHFIGTTDNQPLLFRVNNQRAGLIDPAKSNAFFGAFSNGTASTGQSNAAFGNYALNSNTTGGNNTAMGRDALRLNTTGGDNTAIGTASLAKNTTGIWNTALGNGALYSSTTSSSNTALGDLALTANLTGGANTGVGEDALRRNTTGAGNTALGENALNFNITGSNNTGLGRSTSIVNFSNATAIGYTATANANNKIRLGNATITSLESQVNLTVTSDRRFKKDFREDVSGLDFIMRLRPVTYHYDIHALNDFYGVTERIRADASKGSEKQKDVAKELADLDASARAAEQVRYTGFVAQEVEEAAAEVGYDFSGVYKPQNERDNYGLRYAEFTVPIVKAVQEQQLIIEKQGRQIAELQEMVQALLAGTSSEREAEKSSVSAPFALSPNPSTGAITLTFVLRNDATVNISIFDPSGRLMLSEPLGLLAAGSNHHNLDLQKLPNGTYFVYMVLDGHPISKQVVLSR